MSRPSVREKVIPYSGDMIPATIAIVEEIELRGFRELVTATAVVLRDDYDLNDHAFAEKLAAYIWSGNPELAGAFRLAAVGPVRLPLIAVGELGSTSIFGNFALNSWDVPSTLALSEAAWSRHDPLNTNNVRDAIQELSAGDAYLLDETRSPILSLTRGSPHAQAYVQARFDRGFGLCRRSVKTVTHEFGIVDPIHADDIAAKVWLVYPRHHLFWIDWAAQPAAVVDGEKSARGFMDQLRSRTPALFDTGARVLPEEYLRLLNEAASAVPGSPSDGELQSHIQIVTTANAATRRRDCFRLRQRLATDVENAAFAYEFA